MLDTNCGQQEKVTMTLTLNSLNNIRNGKSRSRINGRQKMEKINDSIQFSGAERTTRLESKRNVLFL